MSRSIFKINYNKPFNEVQNTISNVLIQNNFNKIFRNSEEIWKKGSGLLTAMQFIKVEFTENEVVLSAWIETGIGSFSGGEQDLSGVVGAIPKKSLMKVVENIKLSI